MDIKELNKIQLVMLALLLSFVTSIATGITTVTLMQQAPQSFTVPINRVIKQTVEKIQQVEGKTTVQTVVVKEEDLVVDAIAKNQSAIFTISHEVVDQDGKNIEIGLGRGFAVSKDGIIAADAALALVSEKGNYFVKNDSGKFKADFISSDKAGFSFLKASAPVDEKSKLAFTVPAFGNFSKMKTGQKIIVVGSGISSFIFEGGKDIKITVSKLNAGGMVLNLDGEVLGIALSGDIASFANIETITNALKPTSTGAPVSGGTPAAKI